MAKSAVKTDKHETPSDAASQKITKGMRSEGHKFEEAAWEGVTTPPEGAQGFSQYEVGNQDNAEAGSAQEGANAIQAQLDNGMVDSHESFSDNMKNKITGFEN